MTWQERFEPAKSRLLQDHSICESNRKLFAAFFEFQEYKLKRKNGLPRLDEPSYKTLYEYVRLLRNVNTWFGNRAWGSLTKEDIKRVYDDLEDGKITILSGEPIKDRASYYNKVMKSKPFRMAGKSELARDVIEFYTRDRGEVRFVTEETFRQMVSVLSKPQHLLLFWLAWDLGENIDALLKLRGRDFRRDKNRHTKEAEYLVNLPREAIKRSRKSRTEPTLYAETVRFADMVLADVGPNDRVFSFGYGQAWKLMSVVVAKTRAKAVPDQIAVRWKDLRSGMACHLLKVGWSREEVDARLGHTPNSTALNAYINYLAIDRERPKKRLFDSSLEEVQSQLEERAHREKLLAERLQRQQEENQQLKTQLDTMRDDLRAIQNSLQVLQKRFVLDDTRIG